MPNPAPTSSADMHFNDAPGGDLMFDDLFPSEGAVPNATPAATTSAAAAPPATTQPDYFLKTATGTVYKSVEDAQKGIEHKDALIEKLRTEAIARTGVDPVTGQPIQRKDEPAKPVNYLEDKHRYFNDLKAAVDKGDSDAYMQAQTKLIFDTLAPVAPVLHNFARTQAIEQVSGEIKDFRTFLGTDDYKASVESLPSLKAAIEQAESNYAYAANLPELYRLAYYASVGKKGPIVVQSNPTPQTRPTLNATTPPPPEPSTSTEGLTSTSGRKAMIERMERQGIGNVRW